MEVFEHMDAKSHEQLVFCNDEVSGLRAIIAIHDTTLGPALGGTRMWPYKNEQEAIIDALPGNLQRGLVKHLYAHELAHVPIFQHLESVGDDNAAHDAVRASSYLHQI